MNNTVDNRNLYRNQVKTGSNYNLFELLYAFCEKAVAFTERKSVDTVMRTVSGLASFIGGYIYILNVVKGNISFPAAVLISVVLILTGGFAIRSRR